jgi:Fe-S oxidoreductase
MSLERLNALRREMQKCVRCSLCKLVPMPTIQQNKYTSACPPVDEYHFHAYSGGGIQVMALALLDQRITVDQDLANIVSACTSCGMCDVSCKFIMAAERQEVILALKEHLIESGFNLPANHKSATTPVPWADGMDIKTFPQSQADVLLFAGAGAYTDPLHAATARKLAHLLQVSRVDFGILSLEPESGIEAYWTGQQRAFESQAQQVLKQLDECNAKVILTLCGEDLGMLRSKYPQAGLIPQAQVLHASQFLLQLIRQGKLRLPRSQAVRLTYHDPCYLGRQSEPPLNWHGEERQTHGVMRYFVPSKPINYGVKGVFDAPRQVLRFLPGVQFTEMHRIREYAYCCGGGGGVPQAHPNVARSAALQRMNEARDVGAEVLVTACQHCRENLTRWQDGNPLPVVDLVDMVYQAAGLG